VKTREADVSKLRHELHGTHEGKCSVDDEVESLRGRVKELQLSVAETEEKLREREREVSEKTGQLSVLERLLDEVRQSAAQAVLSAEQVVASLRTDLAQQQHTLLESQQLAREEYAAEKAMLLEQLQSLNSVNEGLLQREAAAKLEAAEAAQQHAREIDQLRQVEADLQKQLHDRELQASTKASESLAALTQEVAARTSADNAAADAMRKATAAEQAANDAEVRLAVLESDKAALEKQIAWFEGRINEQHVEMETAKHNHAQQAVGLEEQVEKLRAALAEALLALGSSVAECDIVRGLLSAQGPAGLGLYVKETSRNDGFVIESIHAGGSAHRHGSLHVGDLVMAIDGRPTSTMTIETVRAQIVGDPGSYVTLDVRRVDESLDRSLDKSMESRGTARGLRFEARLVRGTTAFVNLLDKFEEQKSQLETARDLLQTLCNGTAQLAAKNPKQLLAGHRALAATGPRTSPPSVSPQLAPVSTTPTPSSAPPTANTQQTKAARPVPELNLSALTPSPTAAAVARSSPKEVSGKAPSKRTSGNPPSRSTRPSSRR